MAAVICSNFGAQENKICYCFPISFTVFPPSVSLFPHLFAIKWWNQLLWSYFFECWVLSQLFHSPFTFIRTSLVAQTVNCLPTMRETRVQSLSREDPLEKEMATHSIVLTWRIPGTGEPGGLPSMGLHRVGHDWSNLAAAAAAFMVSALYWNSEVFHNLYVIWN